MSARWAIAGLLAFIGGCGAHPPAFDAVRGVYRPSEAYLLDRDGHLMHVSRLDFRERRFEWTTLDAISPALPAMVVAAEDRRFYAHHGVDWWSMLGAARDGIASRTARGASTLTMQTVALLDPSLRPAEHRRTWSQKVRQLAAAVALERVWTKDEILEAYLNLVHFRGEVVGIAAASALLLGKHPSGVDAIDAALLAALLPSPNTPAPRLARRACSIAARATPFDPARFDCQPFDGAAVRLTQRLERPADVPAFAPEIARRLLRTPGQRIVTTLDLDIQHTVHTALASQLRGLAQRNVRDGAAIVLDNAGGVLAWVGSAGPFSTAEQVDGVRAIRQAGSTLKPFLYGIAFDRRVLTPASILDDSALAIETGTGLYVPQNYDREFKGRVSARTALAASLNVPAVRTLALIGLERFHDTLRSLGYSSVVEDGAFYGYSLALGSADVSLLEQANAYRALANGGTWSDVYLEPGPTVEKAGERASHGRRAMSSAAAYLVGDVLSDRSSRAPTFGLDNALVTRYWSAVKTGTSKDMRDNWCIGYSSRFTVGVWVGNFEGDPMHDVSGVTGAAPVWLAIMNALHTTDTSTRPPPPNGVVGGLVRFDPPIEPPRAEWFVSGTELTTLRAVDPTHRPELVSPPDGAILALDPDIPATRQLVAVATRGASPGHRVELDGAMLGEASTPRRVAPSPGAHVLRLLAADGSELDRVAFRVRGVPGSRGLRRSGASRAERCIRCS